MLFTMFQDLLTVIQVFAIFWQYLSSTGDDINYWVYVLILEVITGVCNLTRQGRLRKTTTTTTRNSTVCLCIFSRSAFYPTFRSTFPQAEFRILHVRDFPHSAFYRCPTLPCIVRCGGGAVFLLCPSVNTATCVVHNKHNHICIKHTAIYYLFYLLAPKIITTESETKINKQQIKFSRYAQIS